MINVVNGSPEELTNQVDSGSLVNLHAQFENAVKAADRATGEGDSLAVETIKLAHLTSYVSIISPKSPKPTS